ncbi:hypothetical protein [Dokdonella sp.]|nr:hypothetical protein [Dokdonella sp.]
MSRTDDFEQGRARARRTALIAGAVAIGMYLFAIIEMVLVQ